MRQFNGYRRERFPDEMNGDGGRGNFDSAGETEFELGENASGWAERRFARGMRDDGRDKQEANGTREIWRFPIESRKRNGLKLTGGMQKVVLRIARRGVVIANVTARVIAGMAGRDKRRYLAVMSHLMGYPFRIEAP